MKKPRLFDRFQRKRYAQQTMVLEFFKQLDPEIIAVQVNKAIKVIKVEPFFSGFTEVFSPEKGGDIEVTIKRDHVRPDLFHVNYQFITLPERTTVFREEKVITYQMLLQLVSKYHEKQEKIEEVLAHREAKKSLHRLF